MDIKREGVSNESQHILGSYTVWDPEGLETPILLLGLRKTSMSGNKNFLGSAWTLGPGQRS